MACPTNMMRLKWQKFRTLIKNVVHSSPINYVINSVTKFGAPLMLKRHKPQSSFETEILLVK